MNTVTRFSMTAPLKCVLVTHARDAYQSQQHVSAHWEQFGYSYQPDFEEACRESDAFIDILTKIGAEVMLLDAKHCTGLDCLYVHDPVVTLATGFGLCRMGKSLRQNEPHAAGEWLESHNLPVVGRIEGTGKLEGGDVVWLKPDLVAIGLGYRSNLEGIEQFTSMSGLSSEQVLPVPLAHWNGPSDVLHLMSFISPIEDKTLLVYSRIMPVITRNMLLDNNFKLIELPEEDYDSMGCNVLALGNGKCLIEQKNVRTAETLSKAGMEVLTYKGDHISRPGEGGPTCLTRPLLRG
ncbi:MAG: arginine deiminase family protein [Rhodothermales bacterium]|nr:arginine deiminase family protein [Rhodothermales bacterium]MDG2017140.1 arginine deiminase family protein [Rhodothermales bacterium]